MYEPYRDRIVATEDFQDNFDMVAVFVDAVGKTTAREAAQQWCGSPQALHHAAGLDVLCVRAAEDDLAKAALQARQSGLTPRTTARTSDGAPRMGCHASPQLTPLCT